MLRPRQYAMDFYESMEGMRVTLPSAVTSGPTASGDTAVVASAQIGAVGTTGNAGSDVYPDGDTTRSTTDADRLR